MKREKLKCPRESCGYEWTPRVDNPVECPYCKHYLKDSGNVQVESLSESEDSKSVLTD